MKVIKKSPESLKCFERRYAPEVEYWKRKFLQHDAIPSPWVDSKGVVVSFHQCYFALKELGIGKILVVRA